MSAVPAWKEAIAAGDTFRFAKTTGDRDLIARAWRRLKEFGADPLSQDMLLLKDVEIAINGLVESAHKLAELEAILNDLSETDAQTVARMCEVFYG